MDTKTDRPFALPADSVEILLDLPIPTSTNRIWRYARGRVWKSAEYTQWCQNADISYMVQRASQRGSRAKINGPFEAEIFLAGSRGDGDNRIKALLDWLQSREIIRNDKDCQIGHWRWVEPKHAPVGCRVILRSLHGG